MVTVSGVRYTIGFLIDLRAGDWASDWVECFYAEAVPTEGVRPMVDVALARAVAAFNAEHVMDPPYPLHGGYDTARSFGDVMYILQPER
jgi:hypothetical protein